MQMQSPVSTKGALYIFNACQEPQFCPHIKASAICPFL